jgi:hypothetical protein
VILELLVDRTRHKPESLAPAQQLLEDLAHRASAAPLGGSHHRREQLLKSDVASRSLGPGADVVGSRGDGTATKAVAPAPSGRAAPRLGYVLLLPGELS